MATKEITVEEIATCALELVETYDVPAVEVAAMFLADDWVEQITGAHCAFVDMNDEGWVS